MGAREHREAHLAPGRGAAPLPFGRSYRVENYFYRLSDTYEENTTEHVADLVLPDGVTDVWFRGRARRGQDSDVAEIRVARFNKGTGWQRHLVEIHERALPAPNPGIVDDKVLPGWRKPKVRTEPIQEVPRNLNKPRIPDVCDAMGIPWRTLPQFVNDQGWTILMG